MKPQTSIREPQAATRSAIHCRTVYSRYFRCEIISYSLKYNQKYGTKKEREGSFPTATECAMLNKKKGNGWNRRDAAPKLREGGT